jgi:tRNA dimethylallyltransferase
MKPSLIVICGPTATGKSKLALTLAQRLGTAILSADSRQVYRGFDIGTAKPSLAEQQQVPHYLIDLCDPTETLTLGEYQQQAQGLIAQFHAQGKVPLLVGGTGLYLKSIVQGLLIPRVSSQTSLRSQLVDLGQAHCYQLLQQVDPVAASRIHPHDQVRTLRGLEVFYVTGKPISAQQGNCPPVYPILQLGLDTQDRQQGRQRIIDRTHAMFAQGFVEEVKFLCDRYGHGLPLLETLGYGEVKQFLADEITLEEAQQLTIQHTCQFAKRQRTWFRGIAGIEWIAIDEAHWADRAKELIEGFIKKLI